MDLYLTGIIDAHNHLRHYEPPYSLVAFQRIVAATARQSRYAVVMPNSPQIRTYDEMGRYRGLILETARSAGYEDFTPLMTLYLTDQTTKADLIAAANERLFAGCKFYPAGVTTGAEHGVSDLSVLAPQLAWMDELGLRLLIHGEKPGVHAPKAEAAFVRECLPQIRQMFKGLIVLEHATTAEALAAIKSDELMWGTITPHHLTGTFLMMLTSWHNACKPVWPSEENRQALLAAIAEPGQTRLMAGTDSAPHPASLKESLKGAYGCWNAPVALPYYLAAFKEAGLDLKAISRFLYLNAAECYNLPTDGRQITTEPFTGQWVALTAANDKTAPARRLAVSYRDSDGDYDELVPMRPDDSLPYEVAFSKNLNE